MPYDLQSATIMLRQSLASFATLPDEEWQMIATSLELRHFSKHSHFATEGQRADKVGLVLQGELRQYYARDGNEYTTYFFLEGELVSAYISCFSGQPALVTIEAITDCVCLVFPYSALAGCFGQSKTWERLGRKVAEYLTKGLEERMAGLLTQTPEERYTELLNSPKRKILERIPQHYVANYLGVTPVSLSRIRARLAQKK